MEELTWIQTALKAWLWIGHSREPTKICSNSNTSRLQAGPRPQLSKQPQTCSAPCSSPACPKGGNACGIPAVCGGSRSREGSGVAPPSPRNAGIPCRCSPALSGQATAAGTWAPGGWVTLGNVCLGQHHASQPWQAAPTGFRGCASFPSCPCSLGTLLQHSHGHAWQNLDLCSLPWGNLDTLGCFTFAFFIWSFVFRGNYFASLFLFSKLSEDNFKTLKINQRLPIGNYYGCFKLRERNL